MDSLHINHFFQYLLHGFVNDFSCVMWEANFNFCASCFGRNKETSDGSHREIRWPIQP